MKDWVSIYYCGNPWKIVNTFEVDTFDLANVKWTRSDSCLLVWDNCFEMKVIVYSAMSGEPIARHTQGSGPLYSLGVKSVYVSPN